MPCYDTQAIQITAFGNTAYKMLSFSLTSIMSVLQLGFKGICEVPTNGNSTIPFNNILILYYNQQTHSQYHNGTYQGSLSSAI